MEEAAGREWQLPELMLGHSRQDKTTASNRVARSKAHNSNIQAAVPMMSRSWGGMSDDAHTWTVV